jgi:hypothetical protein
LPLVTPLTTIGRDPLNFARELDEPSISVFRWGVQYQPNEIAPWTPRLYQSLWESSSLLLAFSQPMEPAASARGRSAADVCALAAPAASIQMANAIPA